MTPKKLLLVTPPLLQPNSPYPATAYLKGFLRRKGLEVEQFDLSIEFFNAVFSSHVLTEIFEHYNASTETERTYRLRRQYINTIDTVMAFLRNEDPTLSNLICSADFLPQSNRFESILDIETLYGSMGNTDCAKYLSTLYLEDIADFINKNISGNFELIKYAEQIAVSIPDFETIKEEVEKEDNLLEKLISKILLDKISEYNANIIGFTVPFPGNLLSTLKCCREVKNKLPEITTVIGGGYPTTELRDITDTKIFEYVDYIVLDDGEQALMSLLEGNEPENTFYLKNNTIGFTAPESIEIEHSQRGCPDFSGLPHNKYISLIDSSNPMHKIWGDGKWNKIVLVHGCYWAKCAFCDTALPYIKDYSAPSAPVLADWIEDIISQTNSRNFHFVDEAAPPALLKELALELIRRNIKISWWGNIRFEDAFTKDLCRLLAASGCIAVSGGIETANDRLLELMNKGVTIEQATITMRNFYYAGIMVHGYLMYGFPTQTLPETIDSLEIVRQLFKAELLTSAYWHRFAMTVHSPCGKAPENYGVKVKSKNKNSFANNEIYFSENRNYHIGHAGESLKAATQSYMARESLDKAVHKWFEGKQQPTQIEDTVIVNHLIKPDSSVIYNDNARIIFIGITPVFNEQDLLLISSSSEKTVSFPKEMIDFLKEVFAECSDLNKKIKLSEIKDIYSKYSGEPFSYLYHSKKWDIMREYGLLQI